MSSWSTRVWDDWLKNGTPYHDSDTFVEPQNFKDAVQFRTLVLAVEIDEPTTKKRLMVFDETKRNETKRNETIGIRRNETKRNNQYSTKRNETKRNKYCNSANTVIL